MLLEMLSPPVLLAVSAPPQTLQISLPAQLASTRLQEPLVALAVLQEALAPPLRQQLAPLASTLSNTKVFAPRAQLASSAPQRPHYLSFVLQDPTQQQELQLAQHVRLETTAQAQLRGHFLVPRVTTQERQLLHARPAQRASVVLEGLDRLPALQATTLCREQQFA